MSLLKHYYDSFFNVCRLRDLTELDVEPDMKLPVYGVYHVMLDTGWEKLVTPQIKTLKESGLLDVSEKLFVSCIARDRNDVESLKRLIDSDKTEIIFAGDDPKRYEYPALEFIKEFCENHECLVYYFHSKGISYQSVDAGDARFLSFKRKIEAWTAMMQYFIFDKWRVAVNVLNNGHDTYGCYLWPPKNPTMYSGSFWWASSAYINTLPCFDADVIKRDRFYSERWLFTHSHRFFSAFDTLADLYFVLITRPIYDGTATMWQRTKFALAYNWRKCEKHVFGYNYKKRCQKRFQKLKENLTD